MTNSAHAIQWEGPLTASGKGKFTDIAKVDPAVIDKINWQSELRESGFLVLQNAGNTLDDARRIMMNLGSLVEHERRNEGVLELDGSKDEEEVLRGQEYMPLHKDGLLMGLEVNVVGIFCQQYRDVTAGRTFITDMKTAMQEMDEGHLAILESNGIEAQAVDTAYYIAEGGVWHPMPAMTRLDDGRALSMGFPYKDEERASWRVRVAGVPLATSNAIMNAVESTLMHEPYIYFHSWREGDMLLMDNQRVLHGREAYTGNRTLVNLQVIYN